MCETFTSVPIEEAYANLKKILLDNKCKLLVEDWPKSICVRQGSLSGVFPLSAKKVVSFYFYSEGSGTKISCSSQISSDWKNLTLYGSIVAAVMAGMFLWIAFDINCYLANGAKGFWAWLGQWYEVYNVLGGLFMARLMQLLAILLVVMILFEVLIVVYVYPRRNSFGKRVLERMTS